MSRPEQRVVPFSEYARGLGVAYAQGRLSAEANVGVEWEAGNPSRSGGDAASHFTEHAYSSDDSTCYWREDGNYSSADESSRSQ